MGKFFDFLREQIRRSNATNFKTVSTISDAISRKDVLSVGSAITGEISSAVKDIVKETSSIKQELKFEFSGSPSEQVKDESIILNTDPWEYLKEEFGKVGFDFETIKANKEAYAEVFSEGSPALKKLLLHMWDHEIETKACCVGHEPSTHYYKTVSKSIIEIDKAEFDKHRGTEGYFSRLEEDCAYFTFVPQNNGNESYARYAVRKTFSQLKDELPVSVECDNGLINLRLSRYVSQSETERFFSSIHDATDLYLDMQNITQNQELKQESSRAHDNTSVERVVKDMDASEYSDTLFGQVVDFDVVAQDATEYAKVFASGSPALEKNLLTLWDYGFQTIACGNGYDERLENFSLEAEQNIQSRYDTYLNTSGLQKMSMKKEDYVPKYHGYVAIDASTVGDPELFKKTIDKELKPFKKELTYSIEQGHTDVKPSVTVFLAVERNRPSTYKEMCLGSIEPEKALKLSLPEKTTFDKYFDAITRGVERYSERAGRKKGCLERIEGQAAIKKVKALEKENRSLMKKVEEKDHRLNVQAREIVDLKLQIKGLIKRLEEPVKNVVKNMSKDDR